MKQIRIKNKDYQVPSEWNELTGEQLILIMETLFVKKYEADELILKLFKIICGITYRRWFSLKADDIEEYLYLISFLLDEENLLTNQLIPAYEKLHGPSSNLGNVLMGEFACTEGYFMQWQEDKGNDSLLNSLIGILYRPCKKEYDFEMNADGDCRLPLNENVSEWYAKNFISKWPKEVKLAITTWYSGCRQQLVRNNEEVFGGAGEPAKYGLLSIIRSIAKEGTHGDFESVEKKSLQLMMVELNETIAEGKKMEEQMKKQS